MKKPDFIIMGAMKSATTTLHVQLEMQPGFFMSSPKEPNFFSDDDQFSKGVEWYRSLFAGAQEGDLCGESSTHYTKRPDYPKTVERMKEELPQVKLIYVMRHPIDRLISHYSHQWSQGLFHCDINQAIYEYPELINYSRYAWQLEPFIEAYGNGSILPVFFEGITAHPQSELQRVVDFLEHNRPVTWFVDASKQNVSSERIKKFPGYAFIIDNPVMAGLRRNLVPQRIRNSVKSRLQMKKRPELSASSRDHLEQIFNKDLAQLGKLLGISLNIENYRDSVGGAPVNWSFSGGQQTTNG